MQRRQRKSLALGPAVWCGAADKASTTVQAQKGCQSKIQERWTVLSSFNVNVGSGVIVRASESRAILTLPTPGGYSQAQEIWEEAYWNWVTLSDLKSRHSHGGWGHCVPVPGWEMLQQAFTEQNVHKHRVTEKRGSQWAWAGEDSVIRAVTFIVPGWLLWRRRVPSWGRQDMPLPHQYVIWCLGWLSSEQLLDFPSGWLWAGLESPETQRQDTL